MSKYTTKKTKNSKNLKTNAVEQLRDEKPIHLQHTIKLSRQEFNEGIGKTALMLLGKGKLDLKTTENIQKYIFEFEIAD
ncbi:MAG: hypothetical protein M3033_01315 [Acidobacteriota bacterium]|nr:hypothetical protein [Acidobacteriota bacterium]